MPDWKWPLGYPFALVLMAFTPSLYLIFGPAAFVGLSRSPTHCEMPIWGCGAIRRRLRR